MSQQDLEPQQPAQPAAPAAAAEAPVAQPTVERQIDPNYVAQLEQFARQQQAELNRYEAVKDDVAWMLEDESRLEGVRRYKNAYTEAAKPKFDPTLEPVVEYIDKAVAPMREWVESQKKTAEQRTQAETTKFVADNVAYAQRLVAEKKVKPEQIDQLAAYADALAARRQRNVTIEEAFKDMQSFGGAPVEAAKAPVLRADDGQGGVPGPSETDSKRWVTDFHGSLVDALKAEKRTA